jgi:tRNA nucleotidyltransferase/poly(A) polymerase
MLRDELLRRFPALATLPPHTEVVGGAVRDLMLHVEPADVDVECDEPQACASRLSKVITLGRGDLQVYRVVLEDRIYDFSRRMDLGRRDFTMNAIAIDLTSGQMRDPFDGVADIERRNVRMISPANFQDDPLRMLRAVRLAVQFDFVVEAETIAVIRHRAGQIVTVAAERVRYELDAIFSMNRFRRAVALLHETALDEPLFGYAFDAERFHDADLSMAGSDALLLKDPRAFARRWKWSGALLREVLTLQGLMRDASVIALYDAGESIARQLPALLRTVGREPVTIPEIFNTRSLLDGNEIAALAGIEEGPRLGAIKRALLEAQLRGEVRTREEAVKFVRVSSRP